MINLSYLQRDAQRALTQLTEKGEVDPTLIAWVLKGVASLSGDAAVLFDNAALARTVYDAVHAQEPDLSQDRLGEDLAYLLGAILRNTLVSWERSNLPKLYSLLDVAFPTKESPVWSFIVIEEC